MLLHYLRMALRGLIRHKLYSFINITGMAVALACAILILLFVRDQLSYDAWIPGTQNLYRLAVTFHTPGSPPLRTGQSPFPVLTAVGDKISQVKAVLHVVPEQMTVMSDRVEASETVTFVDPNFFEVLELPLVEGDPGRVLAQPESIVLSESMARRYFGNADPLGRTLRVSGMLIDLCAPHDAGCYGASHPLTVTGVLRDLPHNTQLRADFLVPNGSLADEVKPSEKSGTWVGTLGGYGYVELAPGASPVAVLAALEPILNGAIHIKEFGVDGRGSELERYRLVPFRKAHLTIDRGPYGGMTPGGSRATVYGFALIALLIVLVACSNFMNLATARATLRAQEIALRKVAGARRGQIAMQVLSEATVIALVSLAVALSLVEILLPAYDRFLDEPIRLHYPADLALILAMAGGAVAIGLLSGIYPALVLSGFRPAASLKSGGGGHSGSGLLRSALVIGQFAVAIALGVAALVVFRQISYARSIDLGFARHDVVVIKNLTNLSPDGRDRLARILRSGPGIQATALSDVVPFDLFFEQFLSVWSERATTGVNTRLIREGPGFASLYGMKLLAGRWLPSANGDRTQSNGSVPLDVLISASAARRLGYSPEAAVDQILAIRGAGGQRLRVWGVLDDASINGVSDLPQPTVFLLDPSQAQFLSVRVHAGELPQALAFIDRVWRSLVPSVALQRYFLTDSYNEQFAPVERQGTMFALFVGIAILIGCLGLFGLAVFTAERRTKEIGVRKVSGARAADIVRLMLWRISMPVLLANVIAWPIAYYYLHRWLEGYAYRISLDPLYFLAAGGSALLIAWATVCGNTLRLARTNPVHALRYE
ncbi:MAG: ABC transporter permease [Steroidobacteraceae bacterium]